MPNEIQNQYGSHIAVYRAKDGIIVHMGNDWISCQDFAFDSLEQFQTFLNEGNRVLNEQKEMQGEKEILRERCKESS